MFSIAEHVCLMTMSYVLTFHINQCTRAPFQSSHQLQPGTYCLQVSGCNMLTKDNLTTIKNNMNPRLEDLDV